MTTMLLGVLAASLLGSAHCGAMCGGFVCFYAAGGGASSAAERMRAHLAYHGGRLLSYAALGALAGAIGAGVDRLGAIAGVGRAAAWLAGFLLVLWGAAALLDSFPAAMRLRARFLRAAASGLRLGPIRAIGSRAIALSLRALAGASPPARALALGLLTTLLPCGWLYLFVATASGTGSPLAGAAVMAAFWIGTVPVLAGIGWSAQRAAGPLRRRLPAATAAALIALGILTLSGRIGPWRPGAANGVPSATSAPASPAASSAAGDPHACH